MDIYMTGIDFSRASIREREAFSFTKSGVQRSVSEAVRISGADGCVILSTCNRTELYVSGRPSLTPYQLLCRLKGVNPGDARALFTDRSGEQAARHLFELSCGLKSQIFGEDQIITQVKNAAALSRESHCAGTVLEKLFQTAATAAKRVKSEVFLSSSHPCAASSAISLLRQRLGSLSGVPCLVIGSGEVGKQAARLLQLEGCEVAITQRRVHSEPASMPTGCRVIPYDDRLLELPRSQIVVSATLSPHFTLRKEEVLANQPLGRCIFVDLAVPRDIDPSIAALPFAECYDIDSFGHTPAQEQQEANRSRACEILQHYQEEFLRWYRFRPYLTLVDSIGSSFSGDVMVRLTRTLDELPLSPVQRQQLREQISNATEKTARAQLFSLRERLDPSHWSACFPALAGNTDAKLPRTPPLFSRPATESEGYFPLFTSLQGKKALIVGGGAIALRRVRTLLQFGCTITILSPYLTQELTGLFDDGAVVWQKREYTEGDCAGAALVTACTDQRVVNHQVAEECHRLGIPVSVADCKEECTFLFPAVVNEQGAVVGVSSGGADHRLVRRVAHRIRSLKQPIFYSEGENSNETDH